MYRIGLILGPALFIAAVLEWILRLIHYAELVEKTLPWTKPMIDPVGIWVTMVVGILIFLAAWAERKKEKNQGKKSRGQGWEDGAQRPRIAHSSIGNIDQKASPVNAVDASQKVEIHNHPHNAFPSQFPPTPPPQSVRAPHNVRFIGARRIKTDVEREILDGTEGFVGVKACFLNKIIPGTRTSDFDHVRARIVLRDESDIELVEITRPKWLNHEAGDPVHVEVNRTECILLAVFGNDGEWAMPFVSTHPANYWDDGTTRLMVDACPLPVGELSAEITLVGEDNVGLEPVIARFSLGPQGAVEIKPYLATLRKIEER